MTPKEVLIAARALISDPGKWTRGDYAIDKDGKTVSVLSQDATCWCALGAIRKAGHYYCDRNEPALFLERAIFGEKIDFIDVFNDSHTHEEVIAAFDRAIELASA